MSKPAAEIKLALTKDGFSDDLRKIIKCLKEKDVNHTTMTNRLWEFCEDFEQLSITPFTLDETKELIPLLLERVQALADRAKQEKEIAGVLAVCVLAAKYDFAVRAPLIDGGLIVPLMKIINEHRDQENVLERGLWVANWLIHCNAAAATEFMDLGIAAVLQKTIQTYYKKRHDITWAASSVCSMLSISKRRIKERLLEEPDLRLSLVDVKYSLSGTKAWSCAIDALYYINLARVP